MKTQNLNYSNKLISIVIAAVFIFITLCQPVMSFAEESTTEQQVQSQQESTEPTESIVASPTGNSNNDSDVALDLDEPQTNSEDENAEADFEYEQQASSWRFQNGHVISDESNISGKMGMSRAAFKPWSKVNGQFISSDGSVIIGATKKGIDVSEFQGKIDWAKVKASDIDFVIIRCGYGSDIASQDDARWEYNVRECERLGIPYGVYLYSYANSTTKAKSEAQHTLRLLKGHKPTYPIYYDLEDSIVAKAGRTNIINYANIYCSAIEAKGYKAGIYANLDWWNNKLNSSSLNKYDKWVAQWYKKCTYTGSYSLWQCSENGSVPGINGRVDLNFEFGKDDTDGDNNNTDTDVDNTGGWVTNEDGQTVFKKSDGTILTSQWITYKGHKYYVNSKGIRLTGMRTLGGVKYYFNSSGVLQTSKWITLSGNKYYLKSNGAVAKGYVKIGSYYYGFDSNGVMLTGKAVLNGKRYVFSSSGKAYLYTAKVTASSLNYRTGPSTGYAKKGTLTRNKSVSIIREKNGWGQMSNGYWVKLSYTKKVTQYPQLISYKVKITASALNYRTGPGTSYKIKGTYLSGKTVTIYSEKNGWGKMSNGYWIKLSYTKRV